jgi:hypothetical protein
LVGSWIWAEWCVCFFESSETVCSKSIIGKVSVIRT